MYDPFGFNQLDHKFPMDVTMTLIKITNNISCCFAAAAALKHLSNNSLKSLTLS